MSRNRQKQDRSFRSFRSFRDGYETPLPPSKNRENTPDTPDTPREGFTSMNPKALLHPIYSIDTRRIAGELAKMHADGAITGPDNPNADLFAAVLQQVWCNLRRTDKYHHHIVTGFTGMSRCAVVGGCIKRSRAPLENEPREP